jgi:outer membrane protein OmpA-like peptidoglycan-associated protein
MNHTRKPLLLLLLLLLSKFCLSQDIPGYNNSNYAGVSGIDLQPASIADMRYKVDICLFGGGAGISNNYIGVKSPAIIDGSIFRPYDGDFKQKFLYENTSNDPKSFGAFATVQLPSFAISINKNISVAFTARGRGLINMDNMSPELAHLAYTGLQYNDPQNIKYWNIKLNNDRFNLNAMGWMEYGIDYAQVIKSGGPHFLKVGGRVKYLSGLIAGYFYAKDLSYAWKNQDTLSLFKSSFSYGHSENFQHPENTFKHIDGSSLAFDVGAVYEWRPNYNDFVFDMDGRTNLERRDKNKYKLRIGASILNLGSIKFTKGNGTRDFAADTVNWNVHNLSFGSKGIDSFDAITKSFPTSGAKDYFVFALPTAFSVQIDYQIYEDFYINFTSYTSPRWLNIESKVHDISYYSLTPRWDYKWFGVFLPFSINAYGNVNLGLTLRMGPVIVGSSTVLTPLMAGIAETSVYGMDVYAAVKIPIFNGKPAKDRDHDGVSDKKDKCPDQKGSWAHHGCPDTDGDGVYDDVDQCPTVPGPVENHGCPWPDRDSDGVADKLDSCPTVPGPVANHGCPWGDADKDGVMDNVDSCRFIPGPAENHGCPWGDADNDGIPDNLDSCPHIAGPAANHGCPWGDADNDGVPDNIDSCPHTPGPPSNHGCPVLAKKTQEIVNTAFHALEFELKKSVIKKTSFISLDELAKLMKDHPKYKLKLSGHTDNVGTEEFNEKLSKDRAMAVKDALVKRGVDPDKIQVEWHGSKQPVAPNTTEAGRAKNRRVDMKIVFD